MEEAITIASHNFCHSALPAQFATLALGKADRKGNVELVNAGHTPVLLVRETQVEVIAVASALATALFHEMTVDGISDLDLSYTPPRSSAWDPIQMACQRWGVQQRNPRTMHV